MLVWGVVLRKGDMEGPVTGRMEMMCVVRKEMAGR